MRRQAAYLTVAIAEYFRHLPGSQWRNARSASRQASRRPPRATRLPFSSELPRLLEHAGPGTEQGTITGIFSVLVDGDDHNEPEADAVRRLSFRFERGGG